MGKKEFIKFYKANLCLSDAEFKNFISMLGSPLHSTIRIIDSPFKQKIIEKFKTFKFLTKLEYLDDVYELKSKHELFDYSSVDINRDDCRSIKNYRKEASNSEKVLEAVPNHLQGKKLSPDDKAEIEEYKACKSFIANQTLFGTIQRQEVVSMLPVLFMNIKKNHYVLDMCASPGSKTKQILGLVGDEGLVVANDQSPKRLNILLTETFKIPHKSFMVLQHDASMLPTFIHNGVAMKFDRVLCDVPCSSDGTIRKNKSMLNEWNINRSLGLHDLQYRILKRGLEMVKNDGMVIYSTCSLNPIENECVIQRILLENEDVEILDIRNEFKNDNFSKLFKFRSGLCYWSLEVKNKQKLEPVDRDLGLEKCIRIYPHDQNTGGFFIVGLRKKAVDYKLKNILEEVKNVKENHTHGKLPLIEVESNEILKNCRIRDNKILVTRSSSNKVIYEVSQVILELMKNNKLKIVYVGFNLFEKCSLSSVGYRIKNIKYLTNAIDYDLEIEAKDLDGRELNISFEKGNVVLKVKDFGVLVSGYSTGRKIILFANKRVRKGLLDFLN